MAFASSSTSKPGAGVVTYRHLLSKQSLTPQNPLRVIAHCDIDAAYAQFETVRLGLDPATPVACQQWTGLIAINYPARAFGITRHMDVHAAKRKCPELVAVHVATFKEGADEAGYWPDAKPETHKVSLEPFRRESLKILKVFSESCPTIEKASIDEAYLDFSQPVRDLIIARNPHLAAVPADAKFGLDTPLPSPPAIDWENLGNIVPVLSEQEQQAAQAEQKKEVEAADGDDESDSDQGATSPAPPPSSQVIEQPKDHLNAWSDYALSIAAELMQKCRKDVLEQLGYTCSAGVAKNKILAKLCSAYRKPNAQTILRNDAVPSFLRPLKFTKIRSLGGKLGREIAKEFDVATVGDMWDVPLSDLQGRVGIDGGTWIYNVLRGVEYGEVAAKTDVKTMLSSKNFKPFLTKLDEVMHWLRIIATDLYARLNEARNISPGIWPKTIVLGVRDEKFQTRHRQAAFPATNTLTIDHILKQGERLIKEYLSERNGKIGLIGNLSLSFAGLERAEKGQQAIQGFFGSHGASTSRAGSAPASETLSQKSLGKRKAIDDPVDLTLDSSDIEEVRHSSTRQPNGRASSTDDQDDICEIQPDGPVYRCERCGAIISLPVGSAGDEEESTVHAMQVTREKHEKWHAEQDALPDQQKKKVKREVSAGPSTQKRVKKKKGQQKLKAFFKKS